jgi:hypothetical protein
LLLLAATAGCWLPPVVALTTHRPARPLPFAAAARLPLISLVVYILLQLMARAGRAAALPAGDAKMAASAATLAAQRAYVAVAASGAGVDGLEVPRTGRETFIALYRCYNHGRQPTVPGSAAVRRTWRVRRAVAGDASAVVECINAAFAIGPGDLDYASEASDGRTDQTEIAACLADPGCRANASKPSVRL